MSLIDNLLQTGLTKKEAQTYLALLELGSASIVDISKKSTLKRTTVYEIIKSLTEKGLISETSYGKRKHFIAEPPEKLILSKQKELSILDSLLPNLQALHNVAVEKPGLKFYQGKEGIIQVFDDIILKTDPHTDAIRAIETRPMTLLGHVGEHYFIDLLAKKNERQLMSYTLTTTNKKELDELEYMYPWIVDQDIEIKFLTDPKHQLNLSIYLYQNKIALLAADQLIVLVIENQRLKTSFEFLFETLWQTGKPSKFTKTK